jgi:hypothetical protein
VGPPAGTEEEEELGADEDDGRPLPRARRKSMRRGGRQANIE